MFLKNLQNSHKNTWTRLSIIRLRPATLLKKNLWHMCFRVNFAKFLRIPFLTEHHWWLLLSKMWLVLQFSIFPLYSFIEDSLFILFQQKNEIKKGNILIQFNISYFLGYTFVWRQRCQKNFAREWFLGPEHLTNSSSKTAQTINFKLYTYISIRLLHKTVLGFSLNELVIFYGSNSTSF